MTTQKLPGTDAARHGAGDADLAIMLAAHNAFRRDLTRLAPTTRSTPARRPTFSAAAVPSPVSSTTSRMPLARSPGPSSATCGRGTRPGSRARRG